MSMNIRVTEATTKLVEAHGLGHTSEEYRKAREEYYKVLEEEAKKDGIDAWGWLEYEDPAEFLLESIECEDSKDIIKEVLDDYIRFHQVLEKVFGSNSADKELIEEAKRYINE